MSILARSRSLFHVVVRLRNQNPRLYSSNNGPTEPIAASASVLTNEATSSPAPAPAPAPENSAAAAASIPGNKAASSQPPPPPPPPPNDPKAETPIFDPWVSILPTRGNLGEKPLIKFLKHTLIVALVGGVATAGYATYAYTFEEINDKTKAFRASAKVPVEYDFSSFNKIQAMLKPVAVRVPAMLIELYLGLRAFVEEEARGPSLILPDMDPLEQEMRVFTLVLDLHGTLVYSDWKRKEGWKTFKRPGVDKFLLHLAQFYEIVVYTDHSRKAADRILDDLDEKRCIRYRLSKDQTRYHNWENYRDLSKLNRDLSRVVYVSGHALKNCLQSENCVAIRPWEDEAEDTQLLDLIPFLEYVARNRPADIRNVLASYQGQNIPEEFIERYKRFLRLKQEQKNQTKFKKDA